MAKAYAHSFYHSTAWRRCRHAYMVTQHGICERCGRPGDIVHHKVYITPDNINIPEITLNHKNLELLCANCHNKEHKSVHQPVRDGFYFDEDGELMHSPL